MLSVGDGRAILVPLSERARMVVLLAPQVDVRNQLIKSAAPYSCDRDAPTTRNMAMHYCSDMYKKTLRLLSFIVAVVTVASWVQSLQSQRSKQRRQKDQVDKARWEGEGGATRPAPDVTAASNPL
jgi:hypothetical protein